MLYEYVRSAMGLLETGEEKLSQAILDMRLKALQGLDREKLQNEYQELEEKIAYYLRVLGDENLVKSILKEELQAISDKYGDDRKTEIQDVEDEIDIEDLIEEIVGEIRDEYDGYEEDEITKLDDENYILLGVAKLDDINEELGINIESEDYDSIAGHIINLLDHFPKTGERVSDNFAEYIVLAAEKNRIDKVKVHLLPQINEDEVSDSDRSTEGESSEA